MFGIGKKTKLKKLKKLQGTVLQMHATWMVVALRGQLAEASGMQRVMYALGALQAIVDRFGMSEDDKDVRFFTSAGAAMIHHLRDDLDLSLEEKGEAMAAVLNRYGQTETEFSQKGWEHMTKVLNQQSRSS